MAENNRNNEIQRNTSVESFKRETSVTTLIQNEPTSSKTMAVFNMINCMVGGGIIALPFSMKLSGLPLGLILIAIFAFITDYSLVILAYSANKNQVFTYGGLAEKCFGKPGGFILSTCQFLYSLFGAMSYGITICDNLESVFQYIIEKSSLETTFYKNRYAVLAIPMVFLIAPLTYAKSIGFLAKASTISICFVAYYCLVIIIRFFTTYGTTLIHPNTWNYANYGIAETLAVYAFAFSCHQNTFTIYRSIKNGNVKNFSIVSKYSTIITTILYAFVSVFGFLAFYPTIEVNYLFNYCYNDLLVISARIIFSISVILTFPLQMHAAREVINVYFFHNSPFSLTRHIIISTILMTTCYIISASVEELGPVLAISGSLVASPITIIFPCIIFMVSKYKTMGYWPTNLDKFVIWIVLSIGIFTMVLGFSTTIISLTKEDYSSPYLKKFLYWCS